MSGLELIRVAGAEEIADRAAALTASLIDDAPLAYYFDGRDWRLLEGATDQYAISLATAPFAQSADFKIWVPSNFDGKFLGTITLRKALAQSRNIASVRLIETANAQENTPMIAVNEMMGFEVAADATFGSALQRLGSRSIESLLLEGGAALHAAAWDEGLVDFVRLYSTPHVVGPGGVPFLNGRPFSSDDLVERHVETLGADTLVEGYVHGPH